MNPAIQAFQPPQTRLRFLAQRSPLLASLAMHLSAALSILWIHEWQAVQAPVTMESGLMILSMDTSPTPPRTRPPTPHPDTAKVSTPANRPKNAATPLDSLRTTPAVSSAPASTQQADATSERLPTSAAETTPAQTQLFAGGAQSAPDSSNEKALPPSEQVVTPPRFNADYLANPAPAYPALSRRMSEQGTVFLRVQVSEKGDVTALDIERSSRFKRLDQAALEAVSRWRFAPARRGQQAVAAQVIVPVVFNLTL